jgi:hypothetical protein
LFVKKVLMLYNESYKDLGLGITLNDAKDNIGRKRKTHKLFGRWVMHWQVGNAATKPRWLC